MEKGERGTTNKLSVHCKRKLALPNFKVDLPPKALRRQDNGERGDGLKNRRTIFNGSERLKLLVN